MTTKSKANKKVRSLYNPFTDYYETGKLYVITTETLEPVETPHALRTRWAGIMVDVIKRRTHVEACRIAPGEVVMWLGPSESGCVHRSVNTKTVDFYYSCTCSAQLGNYWRILWNQEVYWIAAGENGLSTERMYIEKHLTRATPESIAAARILF